MAFPAEPVLGAYVEFLYRATILTRALAWEKAPIDQIADLMDAVHNLPMLMSAWERFDPAWFEESLSSYDATWGTGGGRTLRAVLEDCLRKHGCK